MLEAAPEWLRGGNSRVCGSILLIPIEGDGLAEYQTDLNGKYSVEPELINAWAQQLQENYDWLTDVCDFNLVVTPNCNPEYPERPGCDDVEVYVNGEIGGSRVWLGLAEAADDYGVNIIYDSRGTELITAEGIGVIGVRTEDGRAYKAKKGVILACGGFEANKELIRKYYQIGITDLYPRGSFYNRGDGIIMAEKVGAQLWHMNNFVGNAWGIQLDPEDEYANFSMSLKANDYIFIGPDGCRFQSEDDSKRMRHGKINTGGVWLNLEMPTPSYLVFGQKTYDGGLPTPPGIGFQSVVTEGNIPSMEDLVERGIIAKCENAADLAAITGFDADVLQGTLDRWNGFAAAGEDRDFGRGVERDELGYPVDHPLFNGITKIKPYELEMLEFPLYVTQLRPTFLNTQGGPKRNINCQIVDVNDEPIPRLYGAGELGAIYANEYNGGGNLSETIANGRTAARHCASLEPWE